MKVSVSLPEDDVRFLDEYASDRGLESRSAAVQRAIRLLRTQELAGTYESAWRDWEASGDAEAWEVTSSDGLPS